MSGTIGKKIVSVNNKKGVMKKFFQIKRDTLSLKVWLFWASVISCLLLPVTCTGPQCYSCSAVAKPNDCTKNVTCGANERCYTERVVDTDSLQEFYKMGCVAKDVCDQSSFTLFRSSLIGRKRTSPEARDISRRQLNEMSLCLGCCQGNLCNHNLCSDVVSDNSLHRCLMCRYVTSAMECDGVTSCGSSHLCYSQKQGHLYHFGCLPEVQCQTISKLPATSIQGCLSCCRGQDYCNLRTCNSSSDHTITPSIGFTTTTTPPTTTTVKPFVSIAPGTNISSLYSASVSARCSANDAGLITWEFNKSRTLPLGVVTDSIGNFHIRQVNESNAGEYTCLIMTTSGHIGSKILFVRIADTPAIVISISRAPGGTLVPGQSFSLHCNIIGYPLPHITWSYNDPTGTPTIPASVQFSDDLRDIHIDHYNTVHHDGRWTCIAQNKLGQSQAHITIP